MPNRIPTAQQIEDARKLARLGRSEFAALVGVSPVTIYRWERGATSPHGAALRSLRTGLALISKNAKTDACISATIAENK